MSNETGVSLAEEKAQILVVPRGSGITNEDKRALKEAGIHVLVLKSTESVRLLSTERLPIDSNAMLMAVLKELSTVVGYETLKARCFISICKSLEANS